MGVERRFLYSDGEADEDPSETIVTLGFMATRYVGMRGKQGVSYETVVRTEIDILPTRIDMLDKDGWQQIAWEFTEFDDEDDSPADIESVCRTLQDEGIGCVVFREASSFFDPREKCVAAEQSFGYTVGNTNFPVVHTDYDDDEPETWSVRMRETDQGAILNNRLSADQRRLDEAFRERALASLPVELVNQSDRIKMMRWVVRCLRQKSLEP